MKSLFVLPVALVAAVPFGQAEARPAEATLTLSARVGSFCRIEGAPTDALTIEDVTSLGTIREVCNTQGYIVRAAFTNLSGGTVFAGGDQAAVEEGFAEFRYTQAQALTRPWHLRDGVQADAAAPVYLTVSITPL